MLGEAFEREFGDGTFVAPFAGFESTGDCLPVKFHLQGEVVEENLRIPAAIVVAGTDE